MPRRREGLGLFLRHEASIPAGRRTKAGKAIEIVFGKVSEAPSRLGRIEMHVHLRVGD